MSDLRPERLRFKPWPRKKAANNRVGLDREKIREHYLANPHYEFKRYCQDNNYNWPSVKANGNMPWRLWQREWIQVQTEVQDDDVIQKAIALRPNLLDRNLTYLQESAWTADTIRSVFNYHLSLVAKDITFDQQNAEAIARGTAKARYKTSHLELQMLANAAEKIDRVMRSSLLLPQEKIREKIMGLPEITQEQRNEEQEAHELRNIPTQVMGSEGLSSEELTHKLASYFDQTPSTPPEEPGSPTIASVPEAGPNPPEEAEIVPEDV